MTIPAQTGGAHFSLSSPLLFHAFTAGRNLKSFWHRDMSVGSEQTYQELSIPLAPQRADIQCSPSVMGRCQPCSLCPVCGSTHPLILCLSCAQHSHVRNKPLLCARMQRKSQDQEQHHEHLCAAQCAPAVPDARSLHVSAPSAPRKHSARDRKRVARGCATQGPRMLPLH